MLDPRDPADDPADLARPADPARPGERIVLRGAVVLPDRVLEDGLVVVEDGRIAWVGPTDDAPTGRTHTDEAPSGDPAAVGPRVDVPPPPPAGTTLLPGLVDLHCHGGGGHGFPDATTAEDARAAVDQHRRHGTTRLVASLVTAAPETLLARTRVLAGLADDGEVLGVHLEGPFLSRERCGAQDPDGMRPGDPELVAALAEAAHGHLLTMTVAPEVPGVRGEDGVIEALAAVGAVPSVGHTGADAATTAAALQEARHALARAGARPALPTVTHLFNGMPALHHRDPGPVAACLAAAARGEAVVELVGDGVHLDPWTVRTVFELAGDHVALVTDAMAAAGMPDGRYRLGGRDVRVDGGVARLAGSGAAAALAGGTAHLLDVVRRTVEAGVPLPTAVRAASLTPATVLGRDDLGALEAGRRADVVVVDGRLRLVRVLRDGVDVAVHAGGAEGAGDTPTVPADPAGPAGPAVAPLPWRTEARPGAPFVVADGTRLQAPAAVARVAAERLGRLWSATVIADTPGAADPGADEPGADGPGGPGRGTVTLRLCDDPRDLGDLPDLGAADGVVGRRSSALRHADGGPERLREAYRLEVTADGARLTALDLPGLLHGVTTLGLLARDGRVDPVTVVDAPRWSWRGLAVDVARHPLALPDLLRLLDVLTDLKLNVLHLHLTDDQGWRLEVPTRPLLTERSGGTAVGGDPGGHLTVQDWDDLLDHAHARGVTVVPEIDVPGHVNAALHAYGELTPSGQPTDAYTGIEVGFSRLHADLPATAPFLHDVLGDVARRTRGRYVHVGGDEVLTMAPEEYAHLVRTAADAVEDAAPTGRTVVAWQEAARAPLTPGTVLQVWDMREEAREVLAALTRAAEAGARVVLSPGDRAYLDMKYDADSPLGLEWAGHVSLRRSRSWDPATLVPGLDAAHVAGVEAAVWSETTRTLDDVTWLLLPRLAAVAEVAWSPAGLVAGDTGWSAFLDRVRRHGEVWDAAGLRWHQGAVTDDD